MKRIFLITSAILTLAIGFAQMRSTLLPSSVQEFLNERNETQRLLKANNTKALSMRSSMYAPPRMINGVEMVDAYIDIDNEGVISTLKEAGVIVNCVFDGFVTAQIPTDCLERVSHLPRVTDVEISRVLELTTDTVLQMTNAIQVLNGPEYGLPQIYDGSGVIIGMIDNGFDYQHLAFKKNDDNSQTRIVRVYDPEDTTGHPVIVNGNTLKGSVFMGEQIDTLTTDNPGATHGTHTSSIAAGKHVNGYGGMAPGAELVLCTSRTLSTMPESQILNCMRYIFSYADSVGKPCVISLSSNAYTGSHDGTDRFSTAVAQSVGPGRIFVIAAGNSGNQGSYSCGLSKSAKPYNLLVGYNSSSYNFGLGYYYHSMGIDTWVRDKMVHPYLRFHIFDYATKRVVWQSALTGLTLRVNASEISNYYEPDSSIDSIGYLYGSIALSARANKYHISTTYYNLKSKELYTDDYGRTSSRYQIGITIYPPSINNANLVDSCFVDSWLGGSSQVSGQSYGSYVNVDEITDEGDTITTPIYDFYAMASNDGSIGNFAIHDSLISAGAYVARDRYFSLGREQMVIDPYATPGNYYYVSSYQADGQGPLGTALPTVTAPGHNVISALSRYSLPFYFYSCETMNVDGYSWGVMSGTSMSTPAVAGIIAEWLQINPNLSPGDVKRVIAATAIKDEFTEDSITGARFGANGKIDAMAGAIYLLEHQSVDILMGDVNGDSAITIIDVTHMIDYLLTGDDTGLVMEAFDVRQDGTYGITDVTDLIDIILTSSNPGSEE